MRPSNSCLTTTVAVILTSELFTSLCCRDGRFPLDAFISDYGWFTNVPNSPAQDDFGYNPSTFPDPVTQLQSYHNNLHVRFGGIRKPRIANASMLAEVNESGFLLDGAANNLNFSIGKTREWYAMKQAHYLQEGVDFWWNDEGETQYETYLTPVNILTARFAASPKQCYLCPLVLEVANMSCL